MCIRDRVNSDPRLLISDNSEEEEYKVCTGNIKNEEIKIYPSLDTGTDVYKRQI